MFELFRVFTIAACLMCFQSPLIKIVQIISGIDLVLLNFHEYLLICCLTNSKFSLILKTATGELRYVKLAYLENTTCVEVIVHSRTFPLYFIVFDLVCVELAYDENSAVSK